MTFFLFQNCLPREGAIAVRRLAILKIVTCFANETGYGVEVTDQTMWELHLASRELARASFSKLNLSDLCQ
jgi:hypothetical protein